MHIKHRKMIDPQFAAYMRTHITEPPESIPVAVSEPHPFLFWSTLLALAVLVLLLAERLGLTP